ncbi:two-component system response regulator [Arachidicoccus ginsenosidimutans]|uniref:response regulator transcription factor n=1 Tax=Arachidicoccus sp. BS20 TaxID=1850526 RepID=UPI0007F18198|nr:response regulator [Arachidicoccus sp. BS20]ANI88897.1 two-component system response regulator [Arachidicoccus sp. BS20]
MLTNIEKKMPAILLVDDHEDILFFLSALFKNNYRTLTAMDGKEACAILENQYVHLVISDVMMPDMDGFELCSWIKNRPDFAHIPVILLTAKDTFQSKIDGLKKGADVYIEKPFSTEHLEVQVENLLQNRFLIKEFYTSSPMSHIYSPDINKSNEQFLEEIQNVIFEHLNNLDFDVNQLADLLHMSRPTLYRKIKSVFQMAPNELIHQIRLNKAAELIAGGQMRISEVAGQVGYNSLSQFGRHFLKQFSMTPTEYKEKVKSFTAALPCPY